jgi:hypothetical protein
MDGVNVPPTTLHALLRRSVRVCACGHVCGLHAREGVGECRHPKCECQEYRDRIALVKEDAA